MHLVITFVALLASAADARPSVAATLTPVASVTIASSPAPTTSPTATIASAATVTPSPRPTARATPRPSPSPSTATAVVAPTPNAAADDQDDDVPTNMIPTADALPGGDPVGEVRAFRTPDRAAPPAFVAPDAPPPASADDPDTDGAAPEPMPSPDQPYVATVTFHATAAADEIDGFELFVIYPRAAGTFVGTRTGIDCRNTGAGMLAADDQEGGTMRLLLASDQPLTFPLDIVCHFTVQPNASLTPRLIAVNVVQVSVGEERADPGSLTVSVSAR